MGVNGAHNTVGGKCRRLQHCLEFCRAREVAEYCFCRCTGYDPWYCGLTYAPCLTFSVRFLVLTERASPVGWFQSALIAPAGEEL